jgi:hypothetical protein
MNAAIARISSRMANTRWMLAERSENPARNSAGTTEAPTPTPISAELITVCVVVGGTEPRVTRIPAARQAMPNRVK